VSRHPFDPAEYEARIDAVAGKLRERFGAPPDVAVVLGSGLGRLGERTRAAAKVRYAEVGLPSPGVGGHAGVLSVGDLAGRRVAIFSGRLHAYEGHAFHEIPLGIRAARRWGCTGLVLTSAVGGIDPGLRTGDIVVIEDHLNFIGGNPLRGPNLDALGTRFPDLSNLYTPRLRELARACGARHAGIYGAMPGPSYETPAEIRMLGRLGASVVGMSMVPESIAAGHAGMEVLALAVVSNPAAGIAGERLLHADVVRAMERAGDRVADLVEAVVARW
jgi:purine-nucleoside phosphorylase